MKISEEGLRLIRSFEGYHTRLKDGSCTAYQTYLGKDRLGRKKYDVPTIGYGCTHGVEMGMVWSEAEAVEGLHREMKTFEDAVARLVTVSVNQNERDALISFAYNLGETNLAKSTLLRKLNKGDRLGAAKEFHRHNRAGGIVQPGLVARRAREAALFLKPTEAPTEPYMPQTVEASREPPKPATVAAGTCAAGGLALPFIPSIPAPPVDAVSSVAGWQNAAETLSNFAHSPGLYIAVGGILIALIWPKIIGRFS